MVAAVNKTNASHLQFGNGEIMLTEGAAGCNTGFHVNLVQIYFIMLIPSTKSCTRNHYFTLFSLYLHRLLLGVECGYYEAPTAPDVPSSTHSARYESRNCPSK